MHQLCQQRGNFECTEQRLCDPKKQIEDKTLLTSAEPEEVKAQAEEENLHEESTRPTSEEDHPTTVEATIEPCNPEQKTYHHLKLLKQQKSQKIMLMTVNN